MKLFLQMRTADGVLHDLVWSLHSPDAEALRHV
jgi:hypothetical protein